MDAPPAPPRSTWAAVSRWTAGASFVLSACAVGLMAYLRAGLALDAQAGIAYVFGLPVAFGTGLLALTVGAVGRRSTLRSAALFTALVALVGVAVIFATPT